ncbi:MAG: methyltransferase domain-containing protein [Desulfobacterium sp.]|nr:methyltransferase domain-containing protein [Desulfobacterium sp.]MBU3946789.1 methyltransferase domain-containing protein [Pseudomonadota bacterium]MBU4009966.1 methyltransferase domain-containing protein [Pseudomonadota bacterium]MBU4037514.1 methyltransferase domain-containing protein [Pseudomonadota bacterium]
MAYEFDGKKYEKASAHQKEWGAKLIAELALKGNERVLDLGCGDGTNTALIAKLLPNGGVVGIDASTGMINVARPKEQPNLRFILMDINAMEFKDEFDVIFSNATLHWVKYHQHLLKNIFMALKKGGLLRFNFAADGNCQHFFKVIRKAIKLKEFADYFKDFIWPWYMPSVEEYKDLTANSKLQDVKVWGENADRYFPDTRALIGWVDQPSLVPFLACIAGEDKAAFRKYVVEEMIPATKQDDGRYFETFRRINLFARK